MKMDVATHKQLLAHSEDKRVELQTHIQVTAETVHVDTEKHNNYQSDLIKENQDLNSEIQRLKEHIARRERDHQNEKEDINRRHKTQVDTLTD